MRQQSLQPGRDTALVGGEPTGAGHGRTIVRDLSVLVPLDVVGGGAEDVRVVLQQPETLVAPLAQQLPDATCPVIVVEVLWVGLTADGAPVVLGRTQGLDLALGELVLPVEVALGVGPPIAGTAPRTES
jgi:hypothetical protein